MGSKVTIKRSITIEEDLYKDLQNIKTESGQDLVTIINTALKEFRDKYYMHTKSTLIPQELTSMVDALLKLQETRINAKTNQVLSSLAIEIHIMQRILSDQLEILPHHVEIYRKEALEFLRTNNRVLRLDEAVQTRNG